MGVFLPSLFPSTLLPGDRSRLDLQVTNQGDGLATGQIDYRYFLSSDQILDESDILIGTRRHQRTQLNPADATAVRASVRLPGDIQPGHYFVISHIDAGDLIPEDEEANNIVGSDATVEVAWKFGSFAGRRNVKLILLDEDGTKATFTMGARAQDISLKVRTQ